MQWLDNYGDNEYDGYALKSWLTHNADVAIYISALYLAFVFRGPDLVQRIFGGRQNVSLIKKCWMLWNVGLSIFSLYGTLRVTPTLINHLKNDGLHDAICTFRTEEFYTTKVGFAMGLFAVSKLPEFGDTFFLILSGKRNLPFLQWFHHVTTFLFTWYAYASGSSVFIVAASMNYTVHTIMYLYFALAEAGYKSLVRPFAMYITLLQIAQMVGGLYTTGYVLRLTYHTPSGCPGTARSVARSQFVAYCFNFYLFSKMFIETYVVSRRTTGGGGAAKEARKKKFN